MLHTADGDILRQVIDAVGRKDEHNEEISKQLLPFLEHTNPVIRCTSVFILNYRDYHKGFPDIVRTLDDPDPAVRASALAWPWYAYVNDHPETKAKIKKLRNDADASVRDAAKRALAGMSTWYRLWYYHR
jgi:HEAT repeat protein